MRRLARTFGAAVAVTLMAGVGTAPSALASTPAVAPASQIQYELVNQGGGFLCMDDVGGGVGLKGAKCIGAANETWFIATVNSFGEIRFQNLQTMGCLVVVSNTPSLTGCNPRAANQTWVATFVDGADDAQFANVDSTTCLGMNLTTLRIEMEPCNTGTKRQIWQVSGATD